MRERSLQFLEKRTSQIIIFEENLNGMIKKKKKKFEQKVSGIFEKDGFSKKNKGQFTLLTEKLIQKGTKVHEICVT